MFKKFERIYKLLKNLRDDIGGHVRHTKIEAALNGMEADGWGFLELGETLKQNSLQICGRATAGNATQGLLKKSG
jgi:hypothetical protein